MLKFKGILYLKGRSSQIESSKVSVLISPDFLPFSILFDERICEDQKLSHQRSALLFKRVQLYALAYNLGIFLQGADLPEEMADWSLTRLQTRLSKIGARIVRHARAVTFQLAEVAVIGALFRRILAAIHRRRAPPVDT